MSADLYIIAAGKGSRMGGTLPKALVPINDGEPNLTTTLKQIGSKFSTVFVIINQMMQDTWQDYIDSLVGKTYGENVVFIAIKSGLGDGHAVLSALLAVESMEENQNPIALKRNPSDEVVVVWGDTFIQHAEIVDELLSKNLKVKSEVVMEENPYVTLLVDDGMFITSADMSKYGESHPSGWHDQSIFYFKREDLANALYTLHAALWKNGRYITPGGELSLLYTFHFLYNSESKVSLYETDYPTLSFNTPQEVASIQKEIQEKWNAHQSS